MCEVMQQYLSWHGFEVVSLNSGIEAVSLLAKDNFDLLLYNIVIENDGFQLCRKIRNSVDPKLSQAGILIFASEPLELDDYIALRQLKLYFINKYANIGEWIKKISLILRKKACLPAGRGN